MQNGRKELQYGGKRRTRNSRERETSNDHIHKRRTFVNTFLYLPIPSYTFQYLHNTERTAPGVFYAWNPTPLSCWQPRTHKRVFGTLGPDLKAVVAVYSSGRKTTSGVIRYNGPALLLVPQRNGDFSQASLPLWRFLRTETPHRGPRPLYDPSSVLYPTHPPSP